MFPYKLRIAQQLQARDYVARHTLATWYIRNSESEKSFLYRIIFSYECVFHVSGKINKRNVRLWETERPQETQEHQAYSPKVIAWCALSRTRR